MRGARSGSLPLPADPGIPRTQRGALPTIRTLLPYLWEWRWRVVAALVCLVAAKVANVGVPLILKELLFAREAHLLRNYLLGVPAASPVLPARCRTSQARETRVALD